MHYQDVIIETIRLFYAHHFFIAFAGGFLAEELLLFLAFLSVHMDIPMAEVIIFGFLGILTFDSALFLFSRSKIAEKVKDKIGFLRGVVKVPDFVYRFYQKHSLLTLMFSKFIFSVRIPLITYISHMGNSGNYTANSPKFSNGQFLKTSNITNKIVHKKISYKKFLVDDVIAVGFWAIIMIPLAMLAGKGFAGGMHIAQNFERIAGIGILFIIVLYLINKLILDELLIKSLNSIRDKVFS